MTKPRATHINGKSHRLKWQPLITCYCLITSHNWLLSSTSFVFSWRRYLRWWLWPFWRVTQFSWCYQTQTCLGTQCTVSQCLRQQFWNKESFIIRTTVQGEAGRSFPKLPCPVEPRDSWYMFAKEVDTWGREKPFLNPWGKRLNPSGGMHSSRQWGAFWDLLYQVCQIISKQMLPSGPY